MGVAVEEAKVTDVEGVCVRVGVDMVTDRVGVVDGDMTATERVGEVDGDEPRVGEDVGVVVDVTETMRESDVVGV